MKSEDVKRKFESLRNYIENSTEAIWCLEMEEPIAINLPEDEQIDLLYRYAYVSDANDVWARMAGCEKGEEMEGWRLDDVMPRSKPESIASVKELTRANYDRANFETVEVYPTGESLIGLNTVKGVIEDGYLLRIWGTGRDITEQRQLEKKLRESKKDLQKLAGRLISNQEEELRRLARELHDDLTQRLAVLSIDLGNLELQFKEEIPEEAIKQVSQIKGEIIKISEDVHNLSRDLHPSILEDLGLVRAIKSECNDFSSRTGIAVVFTPKNIPLSVSNKIALSIYRIIQEGLTNIARHANTKNAYVFLEGLDKSIQLSIRDTGQGFNPGQVKGEAALGLSSMRERTRLVDGEFSISSETEGGTNVEVDIPLKKGKR